jgi:hypothetical protein
MTSANNVGCVTELFLGEGHFCVLWTIEAVELVLGEFHESVYLQSEKKFWAVLGDFVSTFCLLLVTVFLGP